MKTYGLIFSSLLLSSVAFSAFAEESEDAKTYHSVYENVQNKYILPVNAADVAVSVIKGLNKVDPKIKIADDEKRVTMYYNAKVVKSFLKPKDPQDINASVVLTEKMIKTAQGVSKVADQKDFEIADIILEEGINSGLDGDSKYYPTFSAEKKGQLKHQRNFADRMIDNILYIRILAFNKFTKQSLEDALKENSNAQGLVLDLRGSPGGILSEALAVVDIFLDDGIVASAHSRDENTIQYYNSEAGDKFDNKPMVILIDAQTTSSAEIVASSLKEQSRAKIVGTNSFGKGTRQDLIELPNEAELGLTTAYFYTPSEEKLDKVGVKPDICTFNMGDGKNIDEVISRKQPEQCSPESRDKYNLDLDVALEIIKKRL